MGFFNELKSAFRGDDGGGHSGGGGGYDADEYETRAASAIADVYMFSGCQDSQTSADVSNVASFGLPSDAGPGGAGGACTNALLRTAYAPGEVSWVELLTQMRAYLKSRRYTQIPQLSTSRQIDLNYPFEIGGGYGGNRKALMVGINYVQHSQGRLSGCINDVVAMKNYICGHEGFSDDEYSMRILVDDHHPDIDQRTIFPSRDNLLNSIRWLVDGCQPGDVLFFHYSGHGGQQKDSYSGDEEDGMDETLIPEDYQRAGQITDDELYQELVSRVPQGARLVCVMDCCHSGSILDLPYMWTATGQNIEAVQSGEATGMQQNPSFSAQIKKLVAKYGHQLPPQYQSVLNFGMKFF
eukprot:TRINITY_DN1265_c0_g3_i1.p2 TRINITY_DN1265_c0_g3~~TRINITY_DN1265_c0_g3_i1.p2  ORF type:complete len:353 (+),score=140.72 TRINITY_DN1265_c0_g3_i1:62-1120(+)